MTTQTYLQHLQDNFNKCLEISKAKNHDYAGINDPFRNFKNVSIINVDVAKGILVRIIDKISRINNLLDSEAMVRDEKITDTLLDLVNYSNILLVYVQHETNGASEKSSETKSEEVALSVGDRDREVGSHNCPYCYPPKCSHANCVSKDSSGQLAQGD